MIKNHADIINLWTSPRKLAERIRTEYPDRFTDDDFRRLVKVLETARDRKKLNSRYWNYLVRVAAIDYANKDIDVLVNLTLLVDTQ